MSEEILVSICVITYNHGNYIKESLDSILMQKVDFNYEIVIGDDCSPDNTQEIIKDFKKRYPEKINAILRSENIGTNANAYDVKKRSTGKYIAILEGDDYWTDVNKLQLQVDFLESHPEFFSVAHRHEIVDKEGIHHRYSHENMKLNRFFTKKEAMEKKTELFHLSTILFRNFFKDSGDEYIVFKNSNKYGSHSLFVFFLASKSDIYIMDRAMSAWRYIDEPTATNYTSFASRDKSKIIINDFNKYVNYREYFGLEYNFDNDVRISFLQLLRWSIKSDYPFFKKMKVLRESWKSLTSKDKLGLP
ncbi:MAG: glycosyltransferase family 2 protein, partial [Tissierellia bacterium]|nr:glycosyltransferase family 2 protein [Tissierellia bacterium]